ncbi:hypothetical protein [Burkholderia sp. BCC1047]|uniref:hypothetical protein n=1 Tax=Burkholderia sp. BCC1047 TaxID=2676299 RepID=UPI0015893055|nr:hypothetical protein [Burkholderia sp. BCC1047]
MSVALPKAIVSHASEDKQRFRDSVCHGAARAWHQRMGTDEDLTVSCAISHSGGMMAGNFMSVVNSSSRCWHFVIERCDHNDLIDFGGHKRSTHGSRRWIGPADNELLHYPVTI